MKSIVETTASRYRLTEIFAAIMVLVGETIFYVAFTAVVLAGIVLVLIRWQESAAPDRDTIDIELGEVIDGFIQTNPHLVLPPPQTLPWIGADPEITAKAMRALVQPGGPE